MKKSEESIVIPYDGSIELFQNGTDGDIYIKIPKSSDINVEVIVDNTPTIKPLSALADEYHSIKELYEFRKLYNAMFVNLCAVEDSYAREAREGHNITMGDNQVFTPKFDVHKSWRHNDGELCFGGGWFIVVINLPGGQVTNHYKAEDWDLFNIPAFDKAKYEFDGHTPADSVKRMLNYLKNG